MTLRENAQLLTADVMRYLGSKRRIAKEIASAIAPYRDTRILWEPFCGGLGATLQLAPDFASDVNASLIALYQKVQREGVDWLPDVVTAEQREEALLRDETDPLKAFMRVGCGYGGDWNGGFARNDEKNDYVKQTKNSLKKIHGTRIEFTCVDFMSQTPEPDLLLYLDPPYRDTTGYAQTFNFAAFDARCKEWARVGSVVFVSEYALPFGRCVWEKELSQMNGKLKKANEKLFMVEA